MGKKRAGFLPLSLIACMVVSCAGFGAARPSPEVATGAAIGAADGATSGAASGAVSSAASSATSNTTSSATSNTASGTASGAANGDAIGETAEATGEAALTQGAWLLVSMRWGSVRVELDRKNLDVHGGADAYSCSFAGGAINGSAACNRFFGAYTLAGRKGIRIDGMGSTKMFCYDEPGGLAEHEFFIALGSVEFWEIAGGRLRLYAPEDGSAVEMILAAVER